MAKAGFLLASLVTCCRLLGTAPSIQPTPLLDMAQILLDNYCFPENLVGMQEATEQAISSGEILHISDRRTLATVLSAGVYELQSVAEDPRLNVKTMQESPVPEDPSALEALVETLFNVSVLPGNTGYLQFDVFGEGSLLIKLGEQIAKKVWDLLKDTDNLIVDLRFNTGGSTSALPILLSYLHDTSPLVHIFTIYSRIGNTTTELVRSVQSPHRATIIGEITSGTLMHSKFFPVEDTNIVITVPVINFIDCTGETWLGGGVVPDAIVLAEEAIEQAHKIIAFHQEVQALILVAGDLLEDHYAIAEIAIKFKKVLRSKWTEGSYRSVVDYESLASQLTADLQETSGDHRLHIFYCDGEPETIQDPDFIPKATPVLSSVPPEYLISIIKKSVQVEVLENNIGYFRIDHIIGEDIAEKIGPLLVENIWNKVLLTSAMILDLRHTASGELSGVPYIVSYFSNAEPPTCISTVYDRPSNTTVEFRSLPELLGKRYGKKGLIILTSAATMGAAEEFVYIMKKLGRATVIGEVTRGGCHPPETFRVADSDVYLSVPVTRSDALQDHGWEGVGISPHIPASADAALDTAKELLNEHFGGQK
uniref:Retinol binding protein 3 n=1 Tax=Paramormyrops kingsleyae TaxID=1676925 RepID=A0A3B3T5P0_9TELE